MTYLCKTNIVKERKITTEEQFLISEQGYTAEKLLDGTECQILLDTRASKYSCPNHTICIANHFILYLNLFLRLTGIQVGNKQYVSILFVIPIKVHIHSHRFKVYTLVSDIHKM